MSGKRKAVKTDYEYEVGPGGGKHKKPGQKQTAKQSQSKSSKTFMIFMMVLLALYLFVMPTRISNSLVKEKDFTVDYYTVANGEMAAQPEISKYFGAEDEQTAELRKLIRSRTYTIHNGVGSLTTAKPDLSGATCAVVIKSGDGKFDYTVYDDGHVIVNGTSSKMGYFDNRIAVAFTQAILSIL